MNADNGILSANERMNQMAPAVLVFSQNRQISDVLSSRQIDLVFMVYFNVLMKTFRISYIFKYCLIY